MTLGPNWGTFRERVRAAHTQSFDLPAVSVHNFSGGYDPATGETDTWADDGGADVPAEVVVPDNPTMATGPDGQEAEVEFRAYIRDTAPVDIYGVGNDADRRPTEVAHGGERYVVADAFDEDNGMVRLLCVEA